MAKAKPKFYAVRNGRNPGIYHTWADCEEQVGGYPKAAFKSFGSLSEARAYLGEAAPSQPTAKKPRRTVKPAPKKAAPAVAHEDEPLLTDDGLKCVTLYTDGACTGNPGPGGYGVVLMHGAHRKEMSGGFRLTTNNRMEMLACIVGLRILKGRCAVALYSDSKYVVNAMTKGWARRWQAAGWKKRDDSEALNSDLWEQMLALCEQHQVQFNWVRGHAGHVENERCDQLARDAVGDRSAAIDHAYENNRRK